MDVDQLSPNVKLARRNRRLALLCWRDLRPAELSQLRTLTQAHELEIEAGDLKRIEGNWYVTHSGLLRLAKRRGCVGIRVLPAHQFCSSAESRWVFRATVLTSPDCKGFVGYGDANPGNVSAQVHGAEMRVAETRAVNRALRKAYGIGLCSVEELGDSDPPSAPAASAKKISQSTNGNNYPLRDRLYLLVRQHKLDAGLVKLYAADFCGTEQLRQVNKQKMCEFIDHLSDAVVRDRDALARKLEAYRKVPEGVA